MDVSAPGIELIGKYLRKGASVLLGTQGHTPAGAAISGRIGAEKRPIGAARLLSQPRTSQTISTPTNAETMPAMRNGPSGISARRHGALGAARKAARKMPSIAKNRPSAARKSDIDATALRSTAGLFRRAVRVRRIAAAAAAPARPRRRCAGALPDGSPK